MIPALALATFVKTGGGIVNWEDLMDAIAQLGAIDLTADVN